MRSSKRDARRVGVDALRVGDVVEASNGILSWVTDKRPGEAEGKFLITIATNNRTGIPRSATIEAPGDMRVTRVASGQLPHWTYQPILRTGEVVVLSIDNDDRAGRQGPGSNDGYFRYRNEAEIIDTFDDGTFLLRVGSRTERLPRHVLIEVGQADRLVRGSRMGINAQLPPALDPHNPAEAAELYRRLEGRVVQIGDGKYGYFESSYFDKRGDETSFVVVDEDKVVGFAETKRSELSGNQEVLRFQVARSHRRRGIGTFLFRQMTSDVLLQTNNFVDHCGQSELGVKFWQGYIAKRPWLSTDRHLRTEFSTKTNEDLDSVREWDGKAASEFFYRWGKALREDLTDPALADLESENFWPGHLRPEVAIRQGYLAPDLG